MKKVILTGATGFIGRHALHALRIRGFDIVVFSSNRNVVLPEGVSVRHVDLADRVAVEQAVRSAEASHLLHMAWEPVVGGLWTSPRNLDWVRRTLDLVEIFIANGGKRMTFAGSCAEYDWKGGLCVEDSTPLRPSTYYGACKHGLETIISSLAGTTGVSSAWGRAFFVYGPGEHPSRLGASVVLSLLKGEPALCSHGMQLRDYMHAADVGAGYAALLDSEVTGAYNIASGSAIRVRDLISALAEAAGRPDLVRLGARTVPAYEPPLIVADMSKTHEALNWRPHFTLETGVADTVQAFRKEYQPASISNG